MFPKILSQYLRERRALRRARIKRVRMFNSIFLILFVLLIPIYPVFGAVLYDGSFRGTVGDQIDRSTIIDTQTDYADENALSPDGANEPRHDWTGRKEVEYYTVQEDDTVGQLATDFNLSRNSIRWSNNIAGDMLIIGQKLAIPPSDGIVYTTKQGDTLDAIGRKYKVNSEKIRIANTIGDSIRAGQTLFLPDAQPPVIIPDIVRPVNKITGKYELQVVNPRGAGFVPGQCTFFVAKYWPVKWRGNARSWFKNAQSAGFKTGQTARPGAIVVWYGPGYNLTYGHVAIVISVDAKK